MLPCNDHTVCLVKQRLDKLINFLDNNWTKFYRGVFIDLIKIYKQKFISLNCTLFLLKFKLFINSIL